MSPKTKFFILFVAIPAVVMIAEIAVELTAPSLDILAMTLAVVFWTLLHQLVFLAVMRREIYWQAVACFFAIGVLVTVLACATTYVIFGGLDVNTSLLYGAASTGIILPAVVALLGLVELFVIPDQSLFIVDPKRGGA